MTRLLAVAALALAALPVGAAHATSDPSCADQYLLTSGTAPKVVYYDPEIGFYRVDLDAATTFADGERQAAGEFARCAVSGVVPPLDGCVGRLGQDWPAADPLVTFDIYGGIVIHPDAADPTVAAAAGHAAAFVDCVL